MRYLTVMQVWNLPNQLTLSRIVVVPVLLVLLSLGERWSCLMAGLLFIAAGLTDLMDGYLARRGNQVTNLGKLLDPLADKVLITSVLIMLVHMTWVNVWVAIIIIGRDVMVTGLRAVAVESGVVIAADTYGKIKTVLQIIALVPLILHYSWFGLPLAQAGQFLLYIALALTVFSGVNYLHTFHRHWLGQQKSPGSAD